MKSIKKTAKKFVLASVTTAALLASPSLATADNVLKEVFNVMTVSAGPSSYESQSHNGVAFGSFSARFSLAKPKIIQFSPPSLSVGCGGIDFFAGSIALIKREELVQMGRTIAAGAAVYAFNLAVESICPSCAAGMAWLQNKLDEFNKLASASCNDVVKGLSEAKVGAGIAKGITDVANYNGWQEKLGGYAETKVDTAFSGLSSFLADRTETGKDPKEVVPVLGNIMWNALGKAKVEDWGFGSQWNPIEVQEILMSLAGSLVIDTQGETTTLKKILTIEELVYGKATSTGVEGPPQPLKVYQCDPNEGMDSAHRLVCYNVTDDEGRDKAWPGLYNQAYDMIMGDGSALSGIANKIIYKQSLTTQEKNFINAASVPLMNMMFYLGRDRATQDTVAKLIASDIGNRAVTNFIAELHKILKQVQEHSYSDQESSIETINYLIRVIDNLEQEQVAVAESYKSNIEESRKLYNTFEMLLKSVKAQHGYGG